MAAAVQPQDAKPGQSHSPLPPMPLTTNSRDEARILLINPPVYDTRFHWARWHMPSLLLRIGTHQRRAGCDVKLLDALTPTGKGRLRREQVGKLSMDGLVVARWRFGRTNWDLQRELRRLRQDGWVPGRVFIECFTTFWWEGAREIAQLAREIFTNSRVAIVGAYATAAPDHVHRFTCAEPLPGLPHEMASLPPDWSLMASPPQVHYVTTCDGRRDAATTAAEIQAAAKNGVRQIAFAEQDLIGRHPQLFGEILECVLAGSTKVRFLAPGNLSPFTLAKEPSLLELMRRAGFRQICFADDRDSPATLESDEALVDCYSSLAPACSSAGFSLRSKALSAGICLGRPRESLGARARIAVQLSHLIGSVVIWPFQPPLELHGSTSLELQNGKLFPFREHNGACYRDYLNLLGLAAILNAKYRDYSFDFLGTGLISRFFRESLGRDAWVPDPSIKGALNLPVLPHREAQRKETVNVAI